MYANLFTGLNIYISLVINFDYKQSLDKLTIRLNNNNNNKIIYNNFLRSKTSFTRNDDKSQRSKI